MEWVRGRGWLLKLEITYLTDVGDSLCQRMRPSPVTVHKTKAPSPGASLTCPLAVPWPLWLCRVRMLFTSLTPPPSWSLITTTLAFSLSPNTPSPLLRQGLVRALLPLDIYMLGSLVTFRTVLKCHSGQEFSPGPQCRVATLCLPGTLFPSSHSFLALMATLKDLACFPTRLQEEHGRFCSLLGLGPGTQ